MLENGSGLDPYKKIDYDILNVHLDGEITGLSSLHRAGNFKTSTSSDGKVELEGLFGLHDVQANLHWSINIFGYKLKGTAGGVTDQITTQVKLRVDHEHGKILVASLEPNYIGKIKTHIESPIYIPFADKVITLINDAVANLLKNVVAKLIKGPIRSAVQVEVDKLHLLPDLGDLENIDLGLNQ